MLNKLDSFISVFVPKSFAEGSDERRRARLAVIFSMVLATCGFLYGLAFLAISMPFSAMVCMLAAATIPGAPLLLKKREEVTLAGHWVCGVVGFALVAVTLFTGGIHSPAMAWMVVVPMTALMLTGQKGGIFWALFSTFSMGIYFIVDAVAKTPSSEITSFWLSPFRVAFAVGLIVAVAGLSFLYESNKNKMLEHIEKARDKARQAHREAGVVLDNIQDALLTFDMNGRLFGASSAAADRLFDPKPDAYLWDLFQADTSDASEWLKIGWESLQDGFLPLELCLAQLPDRMQHLDKTLSVRFVPIFLEPNSESDSAAEREVKQIMMVARDISELVEAEAQELRKEEQMEAFRWVMRDKVFFKSFLKEAEARLLAILDDKEPIHLRKRDLHTLKGNSGLFGFKRLAAVCHDVETELQETGGEVLNESALRRLKAQWDDLCEMVRPLLESQNDDDGSLVIQREDHDELLARLEELDPGSAIAASVRQWSWTPTSVYLDRLAEQTRQLALRLDLEAPEVTVEDQGLRLAPEKWEDFFSNAIHLIRNALGHGIEDGEERKRNGKPSAGRIEISATEREDALVIAIADDGRGIPWEKIREKANELGLAEDRLEEVLFVDGLSTAEEVTEISGRGVGMSAVLSSTEALGGKVNIDSTPGEGTRFEFVFSFQKGNVAKSEVAASAAH